MTAFRDAQVLPGDQSPPRWSAGRARAYGSRAAWSRLLLPLAVFPALVFLILEYGAPPVLGALVLVSALVPLLLWPELATLAVVFLLYANIPGVVLVDLGLPRFAAGSFILLLCIPLAHHLVLRRRPLRFDAILLLMLFFLGVMLIGTMGAVDRPVAYETVQKFLVEGMLLYWLMINTVRDWGTLRRVICTVLAVGTLLGGMNIYQATTGSYDQQFAGLAERKLHHEHKREADQNVVVEEAKLYSAMRAGGPGLGSNRFAQIMIVLLPLAFFGIRSARSTRGRLLSATALGVVLVGGVLLTYSRASFLVLVLIVLLAGAARWFRRSHLLIGAILAILLVPLVSPVLYERISTLGAVTDLRDPSAADGSLRGRATEMLAALYAYRDHPVLGVGPGQYHHVYSIRYHQTPEIKFRELQTTRRAHMLYFEMAADTGSIGLALFLAIPLLLLRGLWVQRRHWAGRDRDRSDMATACILAIIAFLGTAVFLSHAYERYYWFLIALASAALYLLREDTRLGSPEVEDDGAFGSVDPEGDPTLVHVWSGAGS